MNEHAERPRRCLCAACDGRGREGIPAEDRQTVTPEKKCEGLNEGLNVKFSCCLIAVPLLLPCCFLLISC